MNITAQTSTTNSAQLQWNVSPDGRLPVSVIAAGLGVVAFAVRGRARPAEAVEPLPEAELDFEEAA